MVIALIEFLSLVGCGVLDFLIKFMKKCQSPSLKIIEMRINAVKPSADGMQNDISFE